MPKCFEIKCTTCQKGPGGSDDALIIDEGMLEYINDKGESITIFKEEVSTKLTKDSDDEWKDLIKKARVFTVTNLICHDCGEIIKEKQVHYEAFGCWVYIFVPIFVWMNCQIIFEGWLAPLLLSWVGLLIAWFASSYFYNKKCGEKNKELRIEHCPACKSEELLMLPAAALKNIKCKSCDNFTMKVTKK
jgi:hypothetical protein